MYINGRKEKNRKYKTFSIAIVLILVIIGTTYAWLRISKESEVINKIKVGDLELVLDDSISEGIMLEKAVPMSERQGKNTQEYTFTLTNNGNSNLNYTLYLDDLDLPDNKQRIEDNKIRYKLVKNGEVITYSSTVYNIRFVEANYSGTFDSIKHKFTNVVNGNSSSVDVIRDRLNQQLPDNCTVSEAFDVFKNHFGTSYTYETKSPSESLLLSTTGTNPNRELDSAIIKPGRKNTYTLQVWIDSKAENEVMDKIFNTKIRLSATQIGTIPICKRATTLHTEICSNQDSATNCQADGYAFNDTITYGNLGTKGVLTTGDAFDCDVNGDEVYDPTTERFYYVSDVTNGITTDNNTAVLIYYNSVSGGIASNSSPYPYCSKYEPGVYFGPIDAIKQLPTTEQWTNVSLTNVNRDITDEKDNVKKVGFSYQGYAARMLTYQEVKSGCYDGKIELTDNKSLSKKCGYLMENTNYSTPSITPYSIWLETPIEYSFDSFAWSIYSTHSNIDGFADTFSSHINVRPVIEVAKSNIDY